jgi:dTMP kinase
VQQGRQPDLTLWFDLPADEAARRRAAARAPDRFESQDASFFDRVREGYRQRQQADPARFAVIDARGDPAAVWRQVEAAVQEHGGW